VLDLTVREALTFFSSSPKVLRRLQVLDEIGLGYLRLGQPATTLSGGEAQRVKLATELSKVATGDTLYILDEPTTGLHFADVQRLLDVLGRLVDAGNTVVVIEHNLDVIKTADRLVDLGPEGGEEGGEVVATGTPEEVAAVEGSYTGRFLTQLVEPAKPKRAAARKRREPVAA
jgi:excinuclease ABC subunit A